MLLTFSAKATKESVSTLSCILMLSECMIDTASTFWISDMWRTRKVSVKPHCHNDLTAALSSCCKATMSWYQ